MIKSTKSLKICWLVILLGLMCLDVFAQGPKVSVKVANSPISKVLSLIEQQTDYRFSYRNVVLGNQPNVTVDMKDVTVSQVLEKVFAGKNIGFNIVSDKSIVIFDKNDQSQSKAAGIIKGKIVDEKTGEPVIGASVVQKGTTNGVITDMNGAFQFSIPVGTALEISSLGYKTLEVTAQSVLNIELAEDADLLNEVLVVGYGTVFKKKTTSAIATVNAEEIASVPVSNITQALAGQAPGLIVTQSGGGVDAMASISIRGGGTPLYVIDNIICKESDFQNINPNDIENISILKDASSTAIYGARAANGIIIVTTKRGQNNALNVDYSLNYSLSQLANLPEHVDSYTEAINTNRAYTNDGLAAKYTDEDLRLYQNGSDPQFHPNTDWYAETLRKAAPEVRHNLSVSGGSDKIRFYSGLGYNSQQSIYKTDANNKQRYNFRTNVEADFKKIGLKVITTLDAYMTDYQNPISTTATSGYWHVWGHIGAASPRELARSKNGLPYGLKSDNPVVETSEDGGYIKTRAFDVKGSVNLEWNVPWVKGLKFNAIGSYESENTRSKTWTATCPTYDYDGNMLTGTVPNLFKSTTSSEFFNTQFLASYSNVFAEKHSFMVMAGLEASGNQYDNLDASRKQYFVNVDQLNAGPSSTMENSAAEGIGEHRASAFGRVRYDYMSKYLAEFNVRYDGSDYFPEGNRWGLFFSGSLAYAISEEKFWKNGVMNKVFDTFKLRASYGEIGNDNVTRYAYVASYVLNQKGVLVDGSFQPTFSEGDLPSTAITWYKTKDFNVGLDFASLSSRLSGSVDYFSKITTGYLSSPSNVGYTSPLGKSLPQVVSDGERIRQGFEFALQWKDRVGDFTYSVGGNYTIYDDRWNFNPYESETVLKNPYQRSSQVGAYSGIYYHNLGYYTSYQDVMNSPKMNSVSNLTAGDIKYEDYNGDGKIDSEDMQRLGTGFAPRSNFGIYADLGYKGWFFNMQWQGAGSYNLYVDSERQQGSNYIHYTYQTDNWTPDNTSSLIPRLHQSTSYNNQNNQAKSDFWLTDAGYIRLKNIALGYDFKRVLLKNATWLSKLALSLSGYNLLTFSPCLKYGFDPEFGTGDGYAYPISRMYSINLNVGF